MNKNNYSRPFLDGLERLAMANMPIYQTVLEYLDEYDNQRDELLAQNERLLAALTRVSRQDELDIGTRVDIGSNGVRDYYISIASEAINETPAQSLEVLKSQMQAEAIKQAVSLCKLKVLDGPDIYSGALISFANDELEGRVVK